MVGLTACEEGNDNWVIVEDVQPGVYVSGSAVVYKSVAPAASFKAGPVDPDTDDRTGVSSLFTWIKADGELFITKADVEGNVVTYGKGETVSDVTTGLVADGSAFKVPEDGLYFLIYNANLNQLTIIPAKFGVIGGAAADGWNSELPLSTITYDDVNNIVEMKGTFTFTKDQMKFRFNGNRGITIPYDASSTITYHTNLGSTGDEDGGVSLSAAATELKGGGKNLAVPAAAVYDVSLKYEVRTGKFTTSVIQGEIIEPEYPETLYMIGEEFGGWDWNDAGVAEMIPVNQLEGTFWCIRYFTAGKGFKWAPAKAWSGDFAQQATNNGFTVSDGNATVAADGLYMVYVDLVNETITIAPAQIYGIGECFGSWDAGNYPFTVSGKTASITTTAAGNLRIYAGLPAGISGTDWWTREFIIVDNKIIYRGKGGDQAPVAVEAGKTVTLDFNAGNGKIE
jgi:hypothetical protein